MEFGAISNFDKCFERPLQSLAYKTGINKFEIFLSENKRVKINQDNYKLKSILS